MVDQRGADRRGRTAVALGIRVDRTSAKTKATARLTRDTPSKNNTIYEASTHHPHYPHHHDGKSWGHDTLLAPGNRPVWARRRLVRFLRPLRHRNELLCRIHCPRVRTSSVVGPERRSSGANKMLIVEINQWSRIALLRGGACGSGDGCGDFALRQHNLDFPQPYKTARQNR